MFIQLAHCVAITVHFSCLNADLNFNLSYYAIFERFYSKLKLEKIIKDRNVM
jgi:hypothetical protein